MERTETCVFCARPDSAGVLGLWVVNDDRWPVHTECWIAAYRSNRLHTGKTRLSA